MGLESIPDGFRMKFDMDKEAIRNMKHENDINTEEIRKMTIMMRNDMQNLNT